MMWRKRLAVVLMGFAAAAAAADPGTLDLTVGRAFYDDSFAGTGDIAALITQYGTPAGVSLEIDDTDSTLALRFGSRGPSGWGLELGYADLGEAGARLRIADAGALLGVPGSVSIEQQTALTGWTAGLAGRYPLGRRLALGLRVGFFGWETETDVLSVDGTGLLDVDTRRLRDRGRDPYYGFDLDFGGYGVFYELYEVGDDTVSVAGLLLRIGR